MVFGIFEKLIQMREIYRDDSPTTVETINETLARIKDLESLYNQARELNEMEQRVNWHLKEQLAAVQLLHDNSQKQVRELMKELAEANAQIEPAARETIQKLMETRDHYYTIIEQQKEQLAAANENADTLVAKTLADAVENERLRAKIGNMQTFIDTHGWKQEDAPAPIEPSDDEFFGVDGEIASTDDLGINTDDACIPDYIEPKRKAPAPEEEKLDEFIDDMGSEIIKDFLALLVGCLVAKAVSKVGLKSGATPEQKCTCGHDKAAHDTNLDGRAYCSLCGDHGFDGYHEFTPAPNEEEKRP